MRTKRQQKKTSTEGKCATKRLRVKTGDEKHEERVHGDRWEGKNARKKVGEWYGSSGANQSKIKCIYIFRWALLVSLSNYFISIFHLHAAQSKSSRPWGKFLRLPSHHYFITFPLVPLWLSAPCSFPYPGHYHKLFGHLHLFSISRFCDCLSPCFMHMMILPHMCPECECTCVSALKGSLLMPFQPPGFMHCVVLAKAVCVCQCALCVCVPRLLNLSN